MQKSTFKPWIGNKYDDTGLYGIKILFLGESHYGDKDTEKAETTINVVKRLGLCEKKCHRFFTTIAKFALLKGSKEKISINERKEFWDKVAFYNYIQEFVADGARKRPSQEMWQSSEEALLNIIKTLEPDLIVILGKELNKHLPLLPENLQICRVNHPSSGFKYSQWMPEFKKSLNEICVTNI